MEEFTGQQALKKCSKAGHEAPALVNEFTYCHIFLSVFMYYFLHSKLSVLTTPSKHQYLFRIETQSIKSSAQSRLQSTSAKQFLNNRSNKPLCLPMLVLKNSHIPFFPYMIYNTRYCHAIFMLMIFGRITSYVLRKKHTNLYFMEY